MRIAYLYSFSTYPIRGGNHLHAARLIEGFLRRGHEIITLGDDSVPDATCFPRTRDGANSLLEAADVLYVRIDGNDLGVDPILVGLMEASHLPMVWEINAPANERLAFSFLGGDRGPPHGLSRWFDQWRRRFHAWKQMPGIRKEEALRSRIGREVYAATCVSTALERYARQGLGIPRAVTIPNAGDPDRQTPDGPRADLPPEFEGTLKVIYAGSPIYPWQGMDTVVDTMRQCQEAGDPIRFILLLNQEPATDLTMPNTLLRVRVPHEEVQAYLRASDVGLVIYRDYPWSPWGFHGSPMKLFEYWACGRPVVATEVGQLAEIVAPGLNGALCQNTADSLRATLLQLAEDRDHVLQMGRNARRQVEEEYNWDHVVHRTLELLDDAVRQKRRTRP